MRNMPSRSSITTWTCRARNASSRGTGSPGPRAPAQYDLALWLINGIGGERNHEEGFRWMRIAANRGHVAAQNKLAKLYVNAIGTRPDEVEATKWYVLSRKAGLADLELEDFFLGIDERTQKEGIARAEAFMRGRG